MAESLWLDSSIIRLGAGRLRELATLAKKKGVRVVVHAHIHLEMCRYYRERARADDRVFSQEYVSSSLGQLGIEVATATFNRSVAEVWAAILDDRYPTSARWKQAKAETVRARMPDGTTVRVEDVPMTTDWLVALEIEQQGDIVAVGDKGEEWSALRSAKPCRALSYDDTMAWLGSRQDIAR